MITLSQTLCGSQARTKTACLILASLLAAALNSAHASTLYSTGFENPPFANGSTLLGQDGWSTAIPPFLNPDAAVITNSVAATGSQSVRVRGADLVDAPEVDPLGAVGSYRRPLNYDAGTGVPVVHLQADVRLDGPVLGMGDLFSANLAGRSGDFGNFELSISSDGNVYGYDNDGIIYSAPITLNAWHTLGITIDFASDTQTFFVDGIRSSPFAFSAGFTSDVLLRESLVVLACPDDAPNGYSRADFTAYFDNVSAKTVPESGSSAVLLTFGFLALMGAHRLQICS